jgi:hypothetical protein
MSTSDLFLSWLELDPNGITHGRIDPFDPSELSKLKADTVSALSIGRNAAITLYSGRAIKAITRIARDKDRFVVLFIDSNDRLNGQVEESFAEAIKRVRNAVFHDMKHSVMMLRESFLVMNDWAATNSPVVRCNFEAGVSAEFRRSVEGHYGIEMITKLATFLCADNEINGPFIQNRIVTLGMRHRIIRGMVKPDAVVSINIAPGDAAAKSMAPAKDVAKSREESNRLRNIAAREALLNSVPMYSSEDLAGLRVSTTTNVSQLGQDLRRAGKVFGLRHGRAWYYPQFQFDAQGVPYPEAAQVLDELGGEAQSFDYLQWFLEPNAHLIGKTPLEIWSKDRQAVVAAAREAHWFDRD